MTLEKTERINLLADIYAPLLGERQRELLQLYFSEDYSLAEVAEIYHISRQAVHDGLQRAVQALEVYEDKLKLLERQRLLGSFMVLADDFITQLPEDMPRHRLQVLLAELKALHSALQ